MIISDSTCCIPLADWMRTMHPTAPSQLPNRQGSHDIKPCRPGALPVNNSHHCMSFPSLLMGPHTPHTACYCPLPTLLAIDNLLPAAHTACHSKLSCCCSPALKGKRSRSSMCFICDRHPFNAANALSTMQQPIVKKRANLLGDSNNVGSPMKKARKRKSRPAPKKQKKCISCCPEGILQQHED